MSLRIQRMGLIAGSNLAPSIRGNVFSFRASDAALITLSDTNKVDEWASFVGDVTGTAAAAQRPTFISSDAVFGGAPAVHFTGSGVFLDLAGTASDHATGAIIIVGSLDSIGGNRPFHSDFDLAAPPGGVSGQTYINNSATLAFLNTGGVPTFFATTSTVLAATGYTLAHAWAPDTRKLSLNGEAATLSARTGNIRRLGRGYLGRGSGPVYLTGKIHSIDAYSYVPAGF